MIEIVRVGMADYKICSSPIKISTLGLGSCVGVVLYDPIVKICGLGHVMLPDSTQIKTDMNRMKFADTCLSDMYYEMVAKGASPVNLVAKIAGGAKMFSFNVNNESMNIGERNVEAVKEKLNQLRIPLLAEDTGKNYSRSIVFNPEDGMLNIRTVGIGEYKI